jgi:hypothetical protein
MMLHTYLGWEWVQVPGEGGIRAATESKAGGIDSLTTTSSVISGWYLIQGASILGEQMFEYS